jgi:hypothetical protein
MPIDRYLERRGLQSQDCEILKQAFHCALAGLHLVDRNDPLCEIVARKVIETGLLATRDPKEIAAVTIRQLGF